MPMGEDPRHGILVALVVILIGLLLLIVAAIVVAPVLVMVLAMMTYVVWWYVSKEGTSFLHHAQEHENRFWTTVAFCFSGALVFVHDSPVALGQWSPVLGFMFVTLFAYTVHSLDRQFHRSRIGRAPNFRLSLDSSTMINSMANDSAQAKCRRIYSCMARLDNRLVATNLNRMIWADMVQSLEREIVTILSDADPAELNYMLPKVGLGLLFYKIKDHPPTKLNRTSLLDLLTFTRISDLNVTSRALVLDALQQMKLSAHRKSEVYAKNVILKTKGDDLSDLKSLTDAKGDFHSIHKLVYKDIKDASIREEVLKHIATQARVQAAHMQLGTRMSTRRSGKAWRKILSDVDDTLTCSGVDRRYPRRSVYPGVLDFYRELDLGANGPTEWPAGRLGNLVFLSARPHLYKDMSEAQSYAKFKKLQTEKRLYTSPTLLAGDLDTGKTMMFTGNVQPVAEKKFQNFAEYVSIYPEFKHVFVGDNGQGDVKAAEMMSGRFPHLMEAIYMHRRVWSRETGSAVSSRVSLLISILRLNMVLTYGIPPEVVPEEKTFGYQGAETRERWKRANIVFVGDYVEAACHAYKNGLIQGLGLQRVCQGAVQQFVDMKFDTPLDRELQRRQINQSVWKANKLLQKAGLEPNWLIRAVRAFNDMDAVQTRFGRGTVVGFRPEDGVYEVLLHWPERGANQAAAAAAAAASAAVAAGAEVEAKLALLAADHAPPRDGRSLSPSPLPLTIEEHPNQASPLTSHTNAAAARGRASAMTSKLWRTAGSSVPPPNVPQAVTRSATSTHGSGGPEEGGAVARAGGGAPIVVPQRGPDAAGGGEVVRDDMGVGYVAPGRNVAVSTASVPAPVPERAGGAEDAAGGPSAAPAAARVSHGQGDGSCDVDGANGVGAGVWGDGRRYEGVGQPDAVRATYPSGVREIVGDQDVAKRRSLKSDWANRERDHEQRSGAGARAWPPVENDSTHQVPWADEAWHSAITKVRDGAGSRSPSSPVSTVPAKTSVAAVAAKAFAASKTGTMLVHAYLQLPDLQKAPPEVKRTYYKDDSDETRATRRSSRRSMFRSGQDAGVATSTRSPAKIATKGFTKGSTVRTSLGPATVSKVRSEDGMCEIYFQKWVLSGGKPAFAVFSAADLVAEPPSVASPAAAKSPSLLGRTGMAISSISSLFKLTADPATTTVTSPPPSEPRVGDLVDTIFGPAAITHVRRPPTLVSPGSTATATTTSTATATATATVTASFIEGRPGAGWSRGKPKGGERGFEISSTKAMTISTATTSATSVPGRRETGATSSHDGTSCNDSVTPGEGPGSTPSAPARGRTIGLPSQGHNAPPRTPRAPLPLPSPSSREPSPCLAPSTPSRKLVPSTAKATTSRPRAHSATAADLNSPASYSGVASAGGLQLSSRGAGDLLPGKLFSPSSSTTVEEEGTMSLPMNPVVDGDCDGDSDNGGAEEEAEGSPLGVKILEGSGTRRRKAGAASPTDAVMYEVSFMKWRLGGNTPARAVLNRASISAEWESRPRDSAPADTRRRSTGKESDDKKKAYSRQKSSGSFFGFISRVGGLGGGSASGGGGGSVLGDVKASSPAEVPKGSKGPKAAVMVTKGDVKPTMAAPILGEHPCEFIRGSCVKTTRLGPALVVRFRPEDGIYQVSLLDWKLKSGGLATAYLNRTAIETAIAVPGAAVRTSMGLGTVEVVRDDGVIVVVSNGLGRGSCGTPPSSPGRVQCGEMTMFLQPSAILRAAKATVGERVDTMLGSGIVRCYSSTADTYTVDLGWGILYTPRGSAIRGRKAVAVSNTLSSKSSSGIINLFRWPLFGGSSATLLPLATL